MSLLVRRFSTTVVSLVALSAALTAEDEGKPSKAAVVKRSKAATAYVRSESGSGTAFCVHPSGLFVTNEHVVGGVAPGRVLVVLNSGQKTQRVLQGTVVRSDKGLDLALVRVEGAKDLPTLPLGADDTLEELTGVIAFGFPFGSALGKPDAYPAVSVNAGGVTALRRDKDDGLHRIQLDASLNPGNSGGPVVTLDGRVVGVVVSGIRGSGVNMAIPVSHVRRFLKRPDIALTLPELTEADQHRAVTFRAGVTQMLPSKDAPAVELILSGQGGVRRVPMKRDGGAFRAVEAAFPARGGKAALRVELKYEDGTVTGTVEDLDLEVGDEKVRLSRVRRLRPGAAAEVELADGRKLAGKFSSPARLRLRVGGQSLDLALAGASAVEVIAPDDAGAVTCTVVVRQGGEEVGRESRPLYRPGTSRAGLDAIRDGKYHKPARSSTPTSYLKAVSSKGDFIGQGKTYSYAEKDITVQRRARGDLVSLAVDGWQVEFACARGKTLAVGEYPDAKRYPFNDSSPGINFSGKGRGANRIAGSFVVWELETDGDRVTRLAIDFVQRCEETKPPLYGMIRYKSSFR